MMGKKQQKLDGKRFGGWIMIMAAPLLLATLLSFPFLANGQSRPSPFGFHVGMTKSEVVTAVGGEKNVMPSKSSTQMFLKTAPNPSREFDSYFVIVSPTVGVCQIDGDVIVEANRAGEQVRTKFDAVKDLLIKRYGPPTKSFDFLHAGALFRENEEFMMSLLQGERTLFVTWSLPDKTSIALSAKGVNSRQADICVSYQFQPEFSTALSEHEKNEQAVF